MKINQPGAHLDHMLRQTRQHHVQLSSMADVKANILLTMSSVVITLSAPHVFKPNLRWAVIVLVVCCLVTIGLAVFAVMPKMPLSLQHGPQPDLESSSFNLLFFGDFTRLSYEEFEQAMEQIMNDPSLTYQAQVREIYALGLFLAHKKYRFLRLAYLAFIIGVFTSFAVMLLASVTS